MIAIRLAHHSTPSYGLTGGTQGPVRLRFDTVARWHGVDQTLRLFFLGGHVQDKHTTSYFFCYAVENIENIEYGFDRDQNETKMKHGGCAVSSLEFRGAFVQVTNGLGSGSRRQPAYDCKHCTLGMDYRSFSDARNDVVWLVVAGRGWRSCDDMSHDH